MSKTRRKLFFDEPTTSSTADAWFNDSNEPSFSSDLSSQSDFSSTPTINMSNYQTFFQPVKINCELENTFADLAKFTEEKLYEMGNQCPKASPIKFIKHHRLINSDELMVRLPIAEDELILKHENKDIVKMNRDVGRNYDRLMTAAKKFDRRLRLMHREDFIAFIDKNEIQCTERTIQNLKKLPTVHFIVFLYLANKYPLLADHTFMTIFTFFIAEMDIYKGFNELEALLKKTTLTKTAMEAYLMVKEGVEKFGISPAFGPHKH